MIDLTPIVNALITLMALLITTFLIPWIKAKLGNEKMVELQKWVKIAVNAAEQIYTASGMGEAKKEYVTNYLKTKGYELDLDTVDALIEACVYEMNLVSTPFKPIKFEIPSDEEIDKILDSEEDDACGDDAPTTEGESEDV